MHIEEWADDVSLSAATRHPVSARRSSQKVLLVLMSGRMWVREPDGGRRELTGPTWVVWFPGETIEYGSEGPTVHWVFALPTGTAPVGSPRPGSLVRLRDPDGSGIDDATVIHYLDESPEQNGPLSLVAEVAGKGIGIYGLDAVIEVVDEADGDLLDCDFGPGGDAPALRRERSG